MPIVEATGKAGLALRCPKCNRKMRQVSEKTWHCESCKHDVEAAKNQ